MKLLKPPVASYVNESCGTAPLSWLYHNEKISWDNIPMRISLRKNYINVSMQVNSSLPLNGNLRAIGYFM